MGRMTKFILGAALSMSIVFSQDIAFSSTVTIQGIIIDEENANINKKDLAAFADRCSKQEIFKMNDLTNRYILFANGKIFCFTKESNEKIKRFLSNSESKLQVKLIISKNYDSLVDIIYIENAK